jgi:uncharacterized protein YbgA (DUF1722 family)/uncharacterized protein YbbK (DUF523 family)
MREFARPVVVVSKCLEFEAVRFDGSVVHDDFVRALKAHVDSIPVCPEMEIGLGVPRAPVRIVRDDGRRRLIQPATGADVTEKMEKFSTSFLDGLDAVDGFILKSRSPSSGIKDVKIYSGAEKGAPVGKGPGFFGGAVLARFGYLAVEDEGRLKNLRIREHFLTKLFALASFRGVKALGRFGELVKFHTRNKFLFMAYNQTRLRALGKTVANHERLPAAKAIQAYEEDFYAALARPSRHTADINVLMHGLGYFSKQLGREEKSFFLNLLEEYRAGRVPLSVPLTVLREYVVRFGEEYLASQTFFSPYPAELVDLADSGKGKPD